MFTESQLVSFGNFLFKTYGVCVHSTDGRNTPLGQREASHADVSNWKEGHPELTEFYPIGKPVWFKLWSTNVIGEILSVHLHEGKIKYDLKLIGDDGETTRIYNVDSKYVVDRLPVKSEG